MRTCPIVCALVLLSAAPSAFAQTRTSASYSITAETIDSGGTRTTCVNYNNDGSLGGITGISAIASPAETAKSGYIGQLYEVTAVQLAASPTTVNEGATRQLAATATLDDATTTALLGSDLSWSVVSGPITSISSGGLATAGVVYQDTAATVLGSYFGSAGILGLTVINAAFNAWQAQYFGGNTPQAAPSYVSDGSGLTNLFKYAAGLVPNNAASTFTLNVNPVTGQPGQKSIVFNPSLTDRTYTVQFSTDLVNWSTLSGPFVGNGSTQTVTDTNATGARKFYRVQVTKP